jgi:FtsH-binding integral membrane protein
MNIILNFVLIKSLLTISPEMAIIGAAMASLTSQTFYLFGLLFYAKRKLNINLKFAQTLKPIIASLGMILVLFSINHYVTLNIYYAIVEVFLGASIYFILMFLIKGITKQDLNLLRSIKGDITKNHKDSDKTSFSL